MSEQKNKISNDSFKNAICYLPFWAIVMLFVENKKSDTLKQNIQYWNILFWIYILINFLVWSFLGGFLFMIYAWISIFFWYKAYSWEKVKIEYIDELEWKFKDKM